MALAVVALAAAALGWVSAPTASALEGGGDAVRSAGTAYANAASIVNNAVGQLTALQAAHNNGDVVAMQKAASTYRTALLKWKAAISAIRYPDSAQHQVHKLVVTTKTELASLSALGHVWVEDTATARVVADEILVEDDTSSAQGASLRTMLGVPEGAPLPAAVFANDRVTLAVDRFALYNQAPSDAFNTADKAHHLRSAIAATKREKQQSDSFVVAISKISFPASVRDDVTALERAGNALSAFYQKRLSAKSMSVLDALGANTTYETQVSDALHSLETQLNALSQ